MLHKLLAVSMIVASLTTAAPPASAGVSDDAPKQGKCGDGAKKKRRALGGFLGSVAGSMIGSTSVGSVGVFLPTSQLLSEALIAVLDCKEQQQAAAATNEAVRGGVGTTTTWTSETRANVSGSSSVTAEEQLADGSHCMTVTDVVIVDGEETTAPKKMCRKPGASGYVRAA